jgi:hypothetical protein
MLFWGGVGNGEDCEKEKAFESVSSGEESAFIPLVSPPNECVGGDPSGTKLAKGDCSL